jgi:hypothetical protein
MPAWKSCAKASCSRFRKKLKFVPSVDPRHHPRLRLNIKVDSAYVRNAIAVTLALVGGKLLLSG